MAIDKRALLQSVLAAIDGECAVIESAVAIATDGATHDESRPEGKYDTRALEASYLAGAQAERLRELRASREFLAGLHLKSFAPGEPVGPSAVVTLEQEDHTFLYFFIPQGGGHSVNSAPHKITILTPQSPLGRAINGKRAGDEFTLEINGQERDYLIINVC